MKKRAKQAASLILTASMLVSFAQFALAADYTTTQGEAYKTEVIDLLDKDGANYSAAVAEIESILFTPTLQSMQDLQTAIDGVLQKYSITIDLPELSADTPTYLELKTTMTQANWLAADADNYVTVVSEGSAAKTLTLAAHEMLFATGGKLLTLTVDGVETPLRESLADNGAKTFTSTAAKGVVLTLTDDYSNTILGSYAGRNGDPYRAALYVDATGKVEDRSVASALTGGSVTDGAATGVTIDATSNDFSAVIVKDAEYTLSNIEMSLETKSDGSGDVNDFSAIGSGIVAADGAKLIIEDSDLYTTGVAKPAILVDSGASALITNTTLRAEGGDLYDGYYNTAYQPRMVTPPWVLGINGNARTTNLLGENSSYHFVDVTASAGGWGVLSTDAGNNMVLDVVNSTITLNDADGNTTDGYGTYVIGNAAETFYGTTFDVGTYAVIMTGGTAKFTSSEGVDSYDFKNGAGESVFTGVTSGREDGPTVVNSDAFGVMAHNSGTTILEKGTIFNTENAVFLIKAGEQTITVDDSQLNSADGVILQLMDNDDTAVGVMEDIPEGFGMPTFNTVYQEAAGYPGIDYAVDSASVNAGGEAQATTATFTNQVLNGSMYNSSGYSQTAKPMVVNLGTGATLTGGISATSAMHWYDGAQATCFTEDEYYKLGHLQNTPYYNGYNTVSVNLTDGAGWTVNESGVISSLTISADSAVTLTNGLNMYVNGVETAPEAGKSYTGIIVFADDAAKVSSLSAAAQTEVTTPEQQPAEPVITPEVTPEVQPTEPVTAPETTPDPQPNETAAKIYVVRSGDNLWKIAQRELGDGKMWSAIYEANKDTIKNANLIYVGQELIIPVQ